MTLTSPASHGRARRHSGEEFVLQVDSHSRSPPPFPPPMLASNNLTCALSLKHPAADLRSLCTAELTLVLSISVADSRSDGTRQRRSHC
eukprot:2641156-Rhodomonas_salina.2